MSDILNKDWVLVLNALFMPINTISIRKALENMSSTKDGENMAHHAMDLDFERNEDGTLDYSKPTVFRVVDWDEWVTLPVREWDVAVHTPRLAIRAPIVIVAKNHDKMIMKQVHPTKRNLYDAYGGRCVWSGKKLSFKEATREHMKPRSEGGGNGWENLAIADKSLNSERGSTPVEKFRFKPQYPLKKPKAKPACSFITQAVRPEWTYFLV